MTIAVTADTESFTLLSQSDSVYIEKLAPQEEKTITFSYRINAKTAAGQYDLELAMDYADGEGNTYSTSGKAKITVQQSSEMQFDDLSFPSEVVVADVVEAKVQAMNLGRSKIYNVRAEIAADGLKPQGTLQLYFARFSSCFDQPIKLALMKKLTANVFMTSGSISWMICRI